MDNLITVTGMVLLASPIGEKDLRLVLLTAERGKITAFARGAKNPKSPLIAGSRPFSFGQFRLHEGRTSYSVREMKIRRYFEELASDLEAVCLASYFCEFAAYYGQEGIDEREQINLLYAALTALGRGNAAEEQQERDGGPCGYDRKLMRGVYELRTMMIHGEYSDKPYRPCGPDASFAWNYVLTSPVGRLFSFRLAEGPREEFLAAVAALKEYYIDRGFKSLEVLESMGF